MPSTKVFTAFLAALAMGTANAGNCKPKPVTTTDVALPGVTTSGTVTAITSGIETGTATTETSAATTTEAACSKYTPYELQPADCGKKGIAPNCADKVIGTPSTCVDWTECGNTCGKTLGCKSFSVKGRTCTLYKTVVDELGWTASEGAGSSEFYDLELCFTCAEESSATSGTETAAGTQTTETATGVQTTETAAGAQTTETAAGTETTETAAGTQTTETAAGTETTETAAGTQTTDAAVTTTEAASTTADSCTAAYTTVDSAPTESCAVQGRSDASPVAMYRDAENADECAAKCADYVSEENADEVCNSFSYQDDSSSCELYAASVYDLNVDDSECEEGSICQADSSFYDLNACYANTCGKQGKVSCRSSQKLGQPVWAANADKCGKICGTTEGCKTFSFTYNGSKCQLYSAALDQLTFTPCNTGVKFYDLETCYTCQNEVTPPATCSKYVADFGSCGSNTHCGTRGSICEEVLIPNVGDASCLENCAKSCINFGAECVYFSYKPATPWGNAKCKLYKSGKIIKNKNSIIKFYQQPCFKCQTPRAS
ncbi:hypothetical protein FLAG1_02437 [Fusarium langsethiae]|uniref:Apple domain-containing protein n=1 Tax=Fusarium langsethiae TaxID=179993 RepID=A0A0M9F2P3_FUSLA|nr:hypothetical protein FLAG1_02437 [Fusarium langsethiae]